MYIDSYSLTRIIQYANLTGLGVDQAIPKIKSLSSQQFNMKIRTARLKEARRINTHTPEQWSILKREFNDRCVRCWLLPEKLEKDHIIPIYLGGDDGIGNIQPLCPRCNRGKSSETTNWVRFRRAKRWGKKD